jgi:hypothetical protein
MFGFAALGIGYMVAGLQLFRVLRGHRVGVAPATWGMVGVLSSSWAVFYFNLGEYPTALGNILFSPLAISIAALCSTNKLKAATQMGACLVAAMTFVFFLPQVGEPLLAGVAAFILLPQLLAVLRAYRSRTSLDGVSVGAWTLNVFVAVLWFSQGVVYRAPEMLFANGMIFLMSVPIVLIVVTQPRRLETPHEAAAT